jgi:hypothetical protein
MDPDLKEFLNCMGQRVVLKDWKKFRGGLDVTTNLTGESSYYTQIDDCEVMFHVAPLIPQQGSQDPSKKRFIGNDIAVIVFKKGSHDVFYPADMASQYNHIYIVVEKVQDPPSPEPTTTTTTRSSSSISLTPIMYRINISNKVSVPTYPPYLESPPIFSRGSDFRRYLLTKIINGERATISQAKMFSAGNARTLDTLLTDAIKAVTT